MRSYVYRGDRMTAPELRGARCIAIERDGKCVCGRGSMLVLFEGETTPRVVVRRQLRKSCQGKSFPHVERATANTTRRSCRETRRK